MDPKKKVIIGEESAISKTPEKQLTIQGAMEPYKYIDRG